MNKDTKESKASPKVDNNKGLTLQLDMHEKCCKNCACKSEVFKSMVKTARARSQYGM